MEGWERLRAYLDMCVHRHVDWWLFQKSVDLSGIIHEKNTMIRKLTQKRVLVYVPSDCGKDALLVKHLPRDGLRDGLWRKDCGCIRTATSLSS